MGTEQMDASELIGAVARTVHEREVDGVLAKAVALERIYPTDVEDLWDAVTNAERLPRWMMPITGELELGGRFQFEGNAGGTITACDPPHAVDATWEYAGNTSWIEVRLDPVGDEATRLTLTHLAHPDEHWERFGPGAGGIGWDLALLGLTLHLTSGEDRPDDADVWLASPEGARFVTSSGRAWRDADVAAGEDPTTADRAAERTIEAYVAGPDAGA